MRPKKVILLVDSDEAALSIRRFLLETRGYRVIPARSSLEALEIVEGMLPGTLDVLIADLMIEMEGNHMVQRAKQMHRGMLPALLTSNTIVNYPDGLKADAFLPKGAGSPNELLERIRILVARKRGPKKHSMAMAESRAIGAREAAAKAVA